MRTSKALQQALSDTVEQLALLGVSGVSREALGALIERNITAVAGRLGIQPASAWRYFDAAALARSIAEQAHPEDAQPSQVGEPPMPPHGNPEMALLIGGFLDALQEGGDLHAAVLNLAANAWMAGHVHGEDGCPGCAPRAAGGHDYDARMAAIRQEMPGYEKWFDPAVFHARLAETGWQLTRRSATG